MARAKPTVSAGELPDLMTPAELSAYLHREERVLQVWRVEGRGPRFVKVEGRVLYRRADVVAYLEGQTRQSTTERSA